MSLPMTCGRSSAAYNTSKCLPQTASRKMTNISYWRQRYIWVNDCGQEQRATVSQKTVKSLLYRLVKMRSGGRSSMSSANIADTKTSILAQYPKWKCVSKDDSWLMRVLGRLFGHMFL